jgi:hypothetical protein
LPEKQAAAQREIEDSVVFGPSRAGAKLAGLLGIYLAALHLILYWPRFPWWYNLGVVILAVPAVLLGGKLAKSVRAAAPVDQNL